VIIIMILVILMVLMTASISFVVRGFEGMAKRWSYAFFSMKPCDGPNPSPFCIRPELSLTVPEVILNTFQPSVASYILATSGLMVKAVKDDINDSISLPGNKEKLICFGNQLHPLLALSFKNEKTRFLIFRGTGTLKDLMEIDMAHTTSTRIFQGFSGFLLSSGFPTVMSFPQVEVEFDGIHKGIKVHAGFWAAYLTIRKEIQELILADTNVDHLCIGGHSMGGSVSQLCTLDLACYTKHFHSPPSITMYVLASTRVGNSHFAKLLNQLAPASFNIKNTEDAIPDSIAPVLPDFTSIDPSAVLDYVTSGRVISFTTHAPTSMLCHSYEAYERGIQNLSSTPIFTIK
jgi:putative lipase involved disintegration of autophagic bodies